MTESNALAKAEAAAVEAADNTDVVRIVAAVLAAQQAVQQQATPAPACQHQHKPGRSAGEWLALACAVCVGGIGIAFASIAIAIGATCATVCLLILRRVWQDMQKGR
ncbi:hypothetical protein [Streptomyces bobili]|uniref:hypothetical protein n=1 Tax=Streptomyces bobili TaxID=67280 RepID=UPI003720BBDA